MKIVREPIQIRTRDGQCRTTVFRPEGGAGAWPAVIFFMDGLGIRPVLYDMCERIARDGYVVLLPDMFYRAGHYDPIDPKVVLGGDVRKALAHLFSATDNERAAHDTEAFLAYLDTRKDVLGKKVGTTGYCMGGAMSLTAAGTYPDRIAAAASFHGGNLASDAPTSPHRLAPKMKGFVYVAGADNDSSYPPEMHARLEKALGDAGVPHRCEIYSGALHGWTMADFPIYKADDAERHFRELRALYAQWLH